MAAPHHQPSSRPQLRQHPVVGAIRDSDHPEALEACPEGTRRGPSRERGTFPLRHQQRLPARTPPSSFPRKRESRAGARPGGVSVSRRSSTIPRHSREGRNPEGRGTPTTNPRLYSDSPNPREPHTSATSSTCRPAHPHRHTGGSRYPEGRSTPTSHPRRNPGPQRTVGAIRDSDHPEALEACPEGTRRGPSRSSGNTP